jgi:hypothetical protein
MDLITEKIKMISKPILGTENKTKMSWAEYIFTHVLPTWVQVFRMNFRIWSDLMTDNLDNYALLKNDDPLEECLGWFWSSLGEDEVYPKEFLEHLLQMVDDIDTGKVKTYTLEECREDLKLLGVDDSESDHLGSKSGLN